MLVQCDFDGTVTRNNLSVLLRERFACAGWQEVDRQYLAGGLTVEQSNSIQFGLIKEPRERLEQFVVAHIDIRPGFAGFVRYCQQETISLVIVSSGLDFYIEAVLAAIGMAHLKLHCAQAAFSQHGIGVRYVDPQGNLVDRDFKLRYLNWLQQRDNSVVYIGDGLSDLAVARQASSVLATGSLCWLLDAESIPYQPFDDFHDVAKQVRHLRHLGQAPPDTLHR